MDLMNWDVDDHMTMIHQPLLMIAGDVSDTRYMTDDAIKKATGTKDKEIYLVKGAQHIETYWVVSLLFLAELWKNFSKNIQLETPFNLRPSI